jgi:hypothetical protein
MRRLIMWNLITLDGYFEGVKNWELPWHEQVWAYIPHISRAIRPYYPRRRYGWKARSGMPSKARICRCRSVSSASKT